MALHGNRLPGISRSDRGRFLPLPDHRDTSLISWHCHSMTVAGRMPARASTAVARPAYRAKNTGGTLWFISVPTCVVNDFISFLLLVPFYKCSAKGLPVKYPDASIGVFDPRGSRQMDMPACPLGSLLAEITPSFLILL